MTIASVFFSLCFAVGTIWTIWFLLSVIVMVACGADLLFFRGSLFVDSPVWDTSRLAWALGMFALMPLVILTMMWEAAGLDGPDTQERALMWWGGAE